MPQEYNREDLENAIEQAKDDLTVLLEYTKDMVGLLRIRSYVKQKTVYRMNVYSAIYQRVHAIISLVDAKQTNAANIQLRSIWEMLAAHWFVNMHAGNLYLEILQALEYRTKKKQWSAIKSLRNKYPNSNTWQDRWSDQVVDERVEWARVRLERFGLKHPGINLERYASLLSRLESLDDFNIANNPNYKFLAQMDYRTFYSLLSDDVHSTIYGTIENSRFTPTGLQIRLDKYDLDTLRCLTTAYSMLLDYASFISSHYKLMQAKEIRDFRKTEKNHHKLYMSFE